MLACALSVLQRVPDFTWQPRELLHQRKGDFLQTGLLSVCARAFILVFKNEKLYLNVITAENGTTFAHISG